jgi:hypothetical protein
LGSELDSFDFLHFDPFCTGGVEIYGLYTYRNVVPKKRGVSALIIKYYLFVRIA